MKIGAQLYTVRGFTRTLDGFAEALKRVADIGYKTVQVSGSCPFEAEWLKEQLEKNGLECALTHTPPERLLNETKKVAEEHKIFGCRYAGLGWNAFTLENGDTPEEFIKKYTPVAEGLFECGVKLMYHNHDQEFKRPGGRLILETLAEAFPKELMGFTLDTFWVQAGGGDPAWWLRNLSGRVDCIHLKDFAYGRRFAVVGEGNMNFGAIFAAAEDAGTKYMLVEQDDCYGEDPFDCLARSYKYLRSEGFE